MLPGFGGCWVFLYFVGKNFLWFGTGGGWISFWERLLPWIIPSYHVSRRIPFVGEWTQPRPHWPFLRGFLPDLLPFGTGLTGGVKYLAVTSAYTYSDVHHSNNKVNYSTILTPAHHSQGVWLCSRAEQQVPSFSCRPRKPGQMLLYLFIVPKAHIATIREI